MEASGFPLVAGGVEAGGVEVVWADNPNVNAKTATMRPILHGKHLDPEAAERMSFSIQ